MAYTVKQVATMSGVSVRTLHFYDVPNPEEICTRTEQKAALRGVIAKLRPTLRNVVELHDLQECSLQETVEALGISVAAAKSRLIHARAALRRIAKLKAVAQ